MCRNVQTAQVKGDPLKTNSFNKLNFLSTNQIIFVHETTFVEFLSIENRKTRERLKEYFKIFVKGF